MSNTYYLQQITGEPTNAPTWPEAFTPIRNDDGDVTVATDPQNHLVTVTANSSIVTIFAAVQCRDVSNNNEPTMSIKPDSNHRLRLFRKRAGEDDLEITQYGGIIIPKKDTTLPIEDRLQVIIGNDVDIISELNVGDQLYVTVTNNLAWNAVDQNFLRIIFMYSYLPR